MYRGWPFRSEKHRVILFNEYSDCRNARDGWLVVYFVAILAISAFSTTVVRGFVEDDIIDWMWMVPVLVNLGLLWKASGALKKNSRIVNTYYEQRSEAHTGNVGDIPLDY